MPGKQRKEAAVAEVAAQESAQKATEGSGNDSTVIITQNMLGKFVMKHQDTGRSVGVRRID